MLFSSISAGASALAFLFLAASLLLGPSAPVWLLPLALASTAAAGVGALRLLTGVLARRGRERSIAALTGAGERVDFEAFLPAVLATELAAANRAIAEFLLALNDDIALLQTSGKKFDLFSSDILFSARHLAELSERQYAMLAELKAKSEEYSLALGRAGGELAVLNAAVSLNAAEAKALGGRAEASRGLLAGVVSAVASAEEAATVGAAAMAETGASTAALARDIEGLAAVVERESSEAAKIGQALAVIEDIVERTHILATNASIEAAHAGARGAGFGVIAQEIRKLAASSRSSLSDIAGLLGSIAQGIEDSARLTGGASGSARRLGGDVGASQARFAAIVEGFKGLDRAFGEFQGVFNEQIGAAGRLDGSASEAVRKLDEFATVFGEGERKYATMAETAARAEDEARSARTSSLVLAQLSGYLKMGGQERNRVLARYRAADGERFRNHGRRDKRKPLLYNLEVTDSAGRLIGYIGDLSASGMLLLSETDCRVGERLEARVILPLSSEGRRSLDFSLEVRRSEHDDFGYRVGCSFVGVDGGHRERIGELLSTLALDALSAGGALSAAEPFPGAGGDTEGLEEL